MGKLFIISGMSGSGKSTLMYEAMGEESQIVSVTTKEIRKGERDGVDYYFITPEQFNELKENDELVDSTDYLGLKSEYGITKEEIDEKLELGNAYSIVDVHVMHKLKRKYKNSVSIFIYATFDDCISNMISRGDYSDYITKRLKTYNQEYDNRVYYDYVIKNKVGYFNETLNIIKNIIKVESSGK